ncbi:MAG TPA: SDR family NAD(P)-dependent oxidoreductase [Usitatibacteraceae bacterium]|nr:SDR family NAD(P)-dependent oxidoreductase [Usitatibacteraceae bacterium]
MALNTPIKNWPAQRVWIIGASTGIGAALAELLHARGARVALSARSRDKLDALAARLGERALALPLDITDLESLRAADTALGGRWGGYDLVVFMAGDYVAMRAWEIDLAVARRMVATNWEGILNGLSLVIPRFLAAKAGNIALVSSVAGYRGLPKALVYGPTKAALINLAETLYIDLKPKGIDVCVINPGFVKTPLTANNDFEMPYLISPEEAAREIVAGLEKGEFEIHFPKAFTRMLKFLRHLSYPLYFKAVNRLARP